MKKIIVILLIVLLMVFSFAFLMRDELGGWLNTLLSGDSVHEELISDSSLSPTDNLISGTDLASATDAEKADLTLSDTDTLSATDAEVIEEYIPSVTLTQDPNLPLPFPKLIIQKYHDYPLSGTIESTSPIEAVTIKIVNIDPNKTDSNKSYTVNYDPAKNILSCDFYDSKNIKSGKCLDTKVNFGKLQKGTYTFTVTVKNAEEKLEVYSNTFVVSWYTYIKLTPANFRSSYGRAIDFFGGDTDKMLFGIYQKDKSSNKFAIEKEWKEKYLTLTKIYSKSAYVHVDALPYVKQAIEYSRNTYVRVRGNGHDSGVIAVADLVETFDGAFTGRFVRNAKYISHHALGTALDLNASTKPNTLNKNNREIIRSEVQDNLIYNGLVTEDGVTYHDFTYTGSYEKYYNGVPYTIQNYLIYELAFYRAGFGWGYYFSHTCDAMHFTLTELYPEIHEKENSGLRKVYDYE